jgi:hypothetical protein
MEQSSSGEANSHSANEEIPHFYMEPKGSLPRSQGHATGPYTEPDESNPHLPTLFLKDKF